MEQEKPLTRIQPKDTLTHRQRHALRTRLYRWSQHDTWSLVEASDITYGIKPGVFPAFLDPRRTWWTEDIIDHAARAVRANRLKVVNPGDPVRSWWVFPSDYARWIASRPDLVGKERAEIFDKWFPETALSSEASQVRKAVLESEFTTDLFDLTLATINEFWLPWQAGKRANRPKEEEIKSWLKANDSELSERMVDAITSLVRPKAGKNQAK